MIESQFFHIFQPLFFANESGTFQDGYRYSPPEGSMFSSYLGGIDLPTRDLGSVVAKSILGGG